MNKVMAYNKRKNAGFTLVEMLVIIGIIGILASALVSSVSHLKRTAKRTRAQSAVNNVKVALNAYLQSEREWTDEMIKVLEVDYDVAKILSEAKLLDLTVPDNPATSTSLDRFGFLDDWGRFELRRNPDISSDSETGTDGISIKDHRLQFRLDTDYDGFVDGTEGSPNGLKFRASVIVWSRGPDGEDDFENSGVRYPKDDLISWNHSGVVSDQ
jgi:prepilin-type N-terminal cleavage/methylation domain-containing protein